MTTPLVRFQGLFILLTLSLLFGLTATSESGDKKKDKDKAGKEKPSPETKFKWGENHLKDKARWEWKILDAAGKQLDRGTFMGRTNGTITQGKDQQPIGNWKKGANVGQFTLTFTEGKLLGTAHIQFIPGDLPMLEGIHEHKKSRKRIHIEIVND